MTDIPPGTCSNAEPPEEIRSTRLEDLDITLYFLAEIEVYVDEDEGVLKSLHKQLSSHIPYMEVRLRRALIATSIRSINSRLFAEQIRNWLAAVLHMSGTTQEERTSFDATKPMACRTGADFKVMEPEFAVSFT